MQYRMVGRTGLRVSEIGFGCGNNAVLMVRASYEDQLKAVRRALDLGINFFDTAFAYGLGKSEENLGRILRDLGADPVISTKIRLEADAANDIKAATIRAVEAGLARLGRERVDFIQLHTRVTLERGIGNRFSLTVKDVLGPNGVIEGFKSMRDLGKVGMTLLKIDRGIDTGPVYGHYGCRLDEVSDSHVVIQHKVVLENLDLLRDKMLDIAAGKAERIDVSGRESNEWGQPWLSAWLRWKRRARRRARRQQPCP